MCVCVYIYMVLSRECRNGLYREHIPYSLLTISKFVLDISDRNTGENPRKAKATRVQVNPPNPNLT